MRCMPRRWVNAWEEFAFGYFCFGALFCVLCFRCYFDQSNNFIKYSLGLQYPNVCQ